MRGRFDEGGKQMEKIVLCIENGNKYQKEAMKYLSSREWRLYSLKSMEKAAIENIIKEIETKEGKLDLLLFAADEMIPQDGAIGTKHDMDEILQQVNERMNGTRAVLEQAVPLMKKVE